MKKEKKYEELYLAIILYLIGYYVIGITFFGSLDLVYSLKVANTGLFGALILTLLFKIFFGRKKNGD